MPTKKAKPKKKVGRPRKEIDQVEFEKLCALQCTLLEFCDWFDITDKTLDRWCKETYNKSFSEIFAIKRGMGKISLRRAQFKLAERSAAMAIFLGKQYLGQRDVIEHMDNAEQLKQLREIFSGIKYESENEPQAE